MTRPPYHFGATHWTFEASFASPVPLYRATFGKAQSGRVIVFEGSAATVPVPIICPGAIPFSTQFSSDVTVSKRLGPSPWLHRGNATRPSRNIRTTVPPSGFSKRQLNGEHSCKKCSLFTIQCSIVILEKLRPSFGACWSVVRKSFLNKSGGRRIPIIESEIRLADFRRSPSAPIESICRLVTRLDG